MEMRIGNNGVPMEISVRRLQRRADGSVTLWGLFPHSYLGTKWFEISLKQHEIARLAYAAITNCDPDTDGLIIETDEAKAHAEAEA